MQAGYSVWIPKVKRRFWKERFPSRRLCQPDPSLKFFLKAVRPLDKDFSWRVIYSYWWSRKILLVLLGKDISVKRWLQKSRLERRTGVSWIEDEEGRGVAEEAKAYSSGDKGPMRQYTHEGPHGRGRVGAVGISSVWGGLTQAIGVHGSSQEEKYWCTDETPSNPRIQVSGWGGGAYQIIAWKVSRM